jgi:hypothetical protein
MVVSDAQLLAVRALERLAMQYDVTLNEFPAMLDKLHWVAGQTAFHKADDEVGWWRLDQGSSLDPN